jgi:hypothetical protein
MISGHSNVGYLAKDEWNSYTMAFLGLLFYDTAEFADADV